MSLTIITKHIKEMKKIGSVDGVDIHLLITFGGLNILTKMEKGEPEILSMGSHLLVVKDLAEKKFKRIQWND